MQLFFDVDGVLLNFERAFVRWLNEHYGLALPADYETTSWYFEDVLTAEQCREAWHVFLGSEAAARMEPYLHPERFNALTGRWPVHLLTNFPDRHMDKRAANLTRLGFRYDSLHHCGFASFRNGTPGKGETVRRLRRPGAPGLFIDDHPKNCLDVLEHNPDVEVWLMSRRFNRDFDHPRIRRARDWGCVIERLDGRPAAAGGSPVRPGLDDAAAAPLARSSE